MFKHKINKNVIYEGRTYKPSLGIVELPVKMDIYNPIEEETDEKEQLIIEANKLGLGSPSILSRNSIDTLKQKIKDKK